MYKKDVSDCFMEDGIAGTAAVLRNHRGETLAGSCSLIDHVSDAPTAEVLALKNMMELADRQCCSWIIFESDCLDVINASNGETNIFGPYSVIMPSVFN